MAWAGRSNPIDGRQQVGPNLIPIVRATDASCDRFGDLDDIIVLDQPDHGSATGIFHKGPYRLRTATTGWAMLHQDGTNPLAAHYPVRFSGR